MSLRCRSKIRVNKYENKNIRKLDDYYSKNTN